jgi:hypothetical protein
MKKLHRNLIAGNPSVLPFQVNVLGAAICSREAIKSMKKYDADDGQIINING